MMIKEKLCVDMRQCQNYGLRIKFAKWKGKRNYYLFGHTMLKWKYL